MLNNLIHDVLQIAFYFVVLGAIGTVPLVSWLLLAIVMSGSPRST